jgi:hypothetical protein
VPRSRTIKIVCAFLVALFAGAGVLGAATPGPRPGPRAIVVRPAAAGAYFDHLVFIILENKNLNQVYGPATYMTQLANEYGIAVEDRYCSVNPSLPNYLCLTGGSDFGCAGYDGSPNSNGCTQAAWVAPNVADRLEAAGLSWKAYMEDMPSNCYASGDSGLYILHHDPFLYYRAIATDPARCNRVVPAGTDASVLVADLQSASTASNFMWLSPNNCDNMHSCSVAQGDSYLSTLVPKILGSPVFTTSRAALLITFDEGYDQPIYTVWAGAGVKRGYKSSFGYNHFSVLATLESNWDLSPLTANDRDAPNMAEFFTGQADRSASLPPAVSLVIVGAAVGVMGIVVIAFLVLRRSRRRRAP